MTDEERKLCDLEKEVAILKAQKADSDRVAHAFWAAVLAILVSTADLIVLLLRK